VRARESERGRERESEERERGREGERMRTLFMRASVSHPTV
jgi:hypothetical protein